MVSRVFAATASVPYPSVLYMLTRLRQHVGPRPDPPIHKTGAYDKCNINLKRDSMPTRCPNLTGKKHELPRRQCSATARRISPRHSHQKQGETNRAVGMSAVAVPEQNTSCEKLCSKGILNKKAKRACQDLPCAGPASMARPILLCSHMGVHMSVSGSLPVPYHLQCQRSHCVQVNC